MILFCLCSLGMAILLPKSHHFVGTEVELCVLADYTSNFLFFKSNSFVLTVIQAWRRGSAHCTYLAVKKMFQGQ